MNEERDGEELQPNVPPTSPGEARDEFARQRGEVQHRGAQAFGVPPPASHIPVGIAPPDPLNVVSIFDTRPISAFDFVQSDRGVMATGAETVPLDLTATVPDGFTAVLRRIRLEFTPNAVVNLSAATAVEMNMNLLRDGGVIPFNEVQMSGSLDVFEWRTHQVFGAGEVFGVRLRGGWAVPIADLIVQAHLYGTLIRTKSRPPETEIASGPVITQTLADKKAEVQR